MAVAHSVHGQHAVDAVLVRRYLEPWRVDAVVKHDIRVVVGDAEIRRDLMIGDGGYVAEYRVGLIGETGEPVVVVAGVKGVGTLVLTKPPYDLVAKHLISVAMRG